MSMESEPLFPLIWRIISKLVEENNLSHADIGEAIKQVLKYYNNSSLGFIDLPYDHAEFRCAYIYLYLTSHIRMVQHFFEEFWALNDVHFKSWYETIQSKNDGKLSVCSIGGGPGTDLFGLYLFVNKHSWPVYINGTILDQYPKWNEIASNLDSLIMERNLNICGDIQYMYYNFFQEMDVTLQAEISRADLITMVKFMSAVGGDQNDAIVNFQKLLLFMKPGSLLYFVDNSGGGYRQAFEKIVLSLDFHNIFTITHKLFLLDQHEVRAMKNHKIHCSPQKGANVTASLWRKPAIAGCSALSKILPSKVTENKFNSPFVVIRNSNSSSSSSNSSPEISSPVQPSWRSLNRQQSNSSSIQSSSVDSSNSFAIGTSASASSSSSTPFRDYDLLRRQRERYRSLLLSDHIHESSNIRPYSFNTNTSTTSISSRNPSHVTDNSQFYRPNTSSYSTSRAESNLFMPGSSLRRDRLDAPEWTRNFSDSFYSSVSSTSRNISDANFSSRNLPSDRQRESNNEETCTIL